MPANDPNAYDTTQVTPQGRRKLAKGKGKLKKPKPVEIPKIPPSKPIKPPKALTDLQRRLKERRERKN